MSLPNPCVLQQADPRIEIVPADSDHVFHIAAHMREEDVAEVRALSTDAPLVALMESFRGSLRVYTVLVDGDPCVMFGVAVHPGDPECGIPWMLATQEIRRIRRAVLFFGEAIAAKAFEGFKRFRNITAGSNTSSHRWLESLGFAMFQMEERGFNGEPLIYFLKECEPCASPPPRS